MFVRRNRLAVTAGAAVAVTLIAGVVLSGMGLVQARLQRDRAVRSERAAIASAAETEQQRNQAVEHRKVVETRAEELRRSLYVSSIARAAMVLETRNMAKVRTLLDACPKDQPHWEWARLDWLDSSATDLVLPGWELPKFTPDGRQVIAQGDLSLPGAIKVWDAVTGNCSGRSDNRKRSHSEAMRSARTAGPSWSANFREGCNSGTLPPAKCDGRSCRPMPSRQGSTVWLSALTASPSLR